MVTTISNISFVYHTDHKSRLDFDCFYANIVEYYNQSDGTFPYINHLTPYCQRLEPNDFIDNIEGNVINIITFENLRAQGIHDKQLLKWSISIDTIEQYAKYLITNDTKFDQYKFYNCSLLWFGSRCQYTFNLNISNESFGDLIIASFNNRKQYFDQLQINTCYSHLSGCYRGPGFMCLDWREICNGIIDCIGENFGIDEQYCEELEINECKKNEYRCHNGAQCIPLELFNDYWQSTDCLDGTDEPSTIRNSLRVDDFIKLDCTTLLTFPCEERSCRNIRKFPCGDGDCSPWELTNNYIGLYEYSCPGTNRDYMYRQAIYTNLKNVSSDCLKLLYCRLRIGLYIRYDAFEKIDCYSEDWYLSNNCSMEYIPFPVDPILAGYFQVIYSNKNLIENFFNNTPPDYVCNHQLQCLDLSDATLRINGLNCRPFEDVSNESYIQDVQSLYSILGRVAYRCSLIGDKKVYTSNSSLFYCQSSDKYISKHRLVDGIQDCYSDEDELYEHSCLLNDSQRYSCQSEKKCISLIGIGYDFPSCLENEDNTGVSIRPSIITFLCDNIFDFVREDDETDENNCELWPCNNPYTRCDTFYQCANGIDELGCPNFGCDIDEFKCNNQNSNDYQCINQAHIYEKIADCSMNNYTRFICRNLFYSNNSNNNNNNGQYLSWKEKNCLTDNDICGYQLSNNQNLFCNVVGIGNVYDCDMLLLNMENNKLICTLKQRVSLYPRSTRYFSTNYLGYLPSVINLTASSSSSIPSVEIKQNKIFLINNTIGLVEHCNRGILIYEGKSYEKQCLCPPSYYGNQCEWQNQRISLTLQIYKINSLEKNNSIYDIFIYLIDDNNKNIYSYEKINFISFINCRTKYNRYLLYPTKPKTVNTNYSIHIDIYEKITLDYYASWYLTIPFAFLPVNRLSTQIIIPPENSQLLINCSLNCGNHGKCFSYINTPKSFCKCDNGYSGQFCNIRSECSCSSDSICLNSSICLCSLHKYGSQCYLKHPSCQPINPCQNNGLCIPIDDRINKFDYICLCKEDSMGLNCQYKSNKIDIYFKTDIIPEFIYAHYITAFSDKQPGRTTIFKKVPFNQNSITLFNKQLFHILFIEYLNNTYLTVLREKFIPSEHISIDINNDSMCVNISQIFNSTILSYNYIRQYKYYQLICLENLKLKCFYDKIHKCICDKNRFANCFESKHNITYDCQGINQCKNNGKCFQDNITCPQQFICMCEKCYYGPKCELTTKGFNLLLDVIFGYYIKPLVSFSEQSKSVKITTSLTILMFVFGFISGILSILTFRRKCLIEVGCGIYLLINSINSLLTITLFTLKYIELLLFQMNIITNPSILYHSCLLTDILLKSFLSSGDWLNACVAIERAFTATQGVNFNKARSKLIAKRIIPTLFLIIIISYIHDPISRKLFDDKDDQRIWCILNYSLNLKKYDRFINLFHFLVPFIINILTALVIIINVFKSRSKVNKKASRKNLLYIEIKRHKHLLISPFILTLLAFPRLLISLSSRCMESMRDPWLYLIGYYISFFPSLLILIIFVLPSEKYREEFITVTKINRCIRR